MPELPEVEIISRGLSRLIVGKVISHVVHDTEKSFPNSPDDVAQFLIGAKVSGISRRAKILVFKLSSGYSLLIHLKMTGQLVFVGKQRFGAGHPTSSLVGSLPDKSTRVTIEFTDDSRLYFNDQRKFGWVKLYPTIEIPNIDFMKRVGPEPLEDAFSAKEFIERLRKRNRTTIKAALLDQTVVAGIGNIYADESLWMALIHPATRVVNVSDSSLKKLLDMIRTVLLLSIEKGGSTDRNYVNADGKRVVTSVLPMFFAVKENRAIVARTL